MSCFYWPSFYIVIGAIFQGDLVSKEDVCEVQKKWEIHDWQRRLNLICRIQCTKEHTVIVRTVEILERCGCTTVTEGTKVLKGEKATVYNVMHVYSTYIPYMCIILCTDIVWVFVWQDHCNSTGRYVCACMLACVCACAHVCACVRACVRSCTHMHPSVNTYKHIIVLVHT